VIRVDVGMPTTRFCRLIGVPERTWRRHQARARSGRSVKGPWPRPAREKVAEAARRHALAHPAWGHRKVWAMCRYEGHPVSQATVLRLLRDQGLLLEANYQRERRQLAKRRKAAFATEPTGANQVWQLDFSDVETTGGGIWRLAGCRDYWSKYELGWHISPTANQHDAITAIELALAEAERLAGASLADLAPRDADGVVQPLVTIVTDNGGPFRSFRFEAFIATRPELRHVRTPGQNGSHERGFGSLKREALPRGDSQRSGPGPARGGLPDRVQHPPTPRGAGLVSAHDVHTGAADPLIPNFPEPRNLPTA
jgi:putative transposase